MTPMKTKAAAVLCGLTMVGAGLLSVGTHAGGIGSGAAQVSAANLQTTPASGRTKTGTPTTKASPTAIQLDEGHELLPQAKITLEKAIEAAKAVAKGDVTEAELEMKNGVLVFEIEIGNSEVYVNAEDGSIVKVKTEANDDDEDDDDADHEDHEEDNAAPGELRDGHELQSKAKITLEQAVKTAQGAATGELGSVELEMNDNGVLVYKVDVGSQEVAIDAQTGKVIETTQS